MSSAAGSTPGPLRTDRGVMIALVIAAVAVVASLLVYFLVFAPMTGRTNSSTPQQYADEVVQRLEGNALDPAAVRRAHEKVRADIGAATSIDQVRTALAPVLAAAGAEFVAPGATPGTDATPAAPMVQRRDGVTTIVAPTLAQTDLLATRQYGEALATGITEQRGSTCGWVIDLRGSAATEPFQMAAALSPFLPDGTVARLRERGGSADLRLVGSEVEMRNAVRASVPNTPDVVGQPIAVLVDDSTRDGGALAALALSSNEQVRIFGTLSPKAANVAATERLSDNHLLRIVTGRWEAVAGTQPPPDGTVDQWVGRTCR